MIKLSNVQGQRPRVAEIECMDDGSVAVREGSSVGRMGTKSTPAGMLGSPTEFVQAKVEEFLGQGFHVDAITDAPKSEQLTFGLRGVSLDTEVARQLVKEFCQKDITQTEATQESHKWVIGGALVNWESLASGISISCYVPAPYALKAAAFFALVGMGNAELVDASGNDVPILPLIQEGVRQQAYSDVVTECLYQARILTRPPNLGAFRNPNRRRGLAVSM